MHYREQVAPLWEKLLSEYSIHIDFAYRTFKWNSESVDKAAVHCVIIGFSSGRNPNKKYIFTGGGCEEVKNINPYLVNASDVLVNSSSKSLWGAPRMTAGNKPADGGNLILSEEEKNEILEKDPSVTECIRRYVGSRDYINNNERRYCLWLRSINPSVYRKNPEIKKRLDAVREMRLKSSAAPTRAYADKPFLFFSAPQKEGICLCIPEVSSERRRYIPMGFLDSDAIASNKLLIIPDATLFHFGVLISNVHMSWTRTVCGRLKSDYQYSGAMVYNTFPWPELGDNQRAKIESTAKGILDVRSLYPEASLADLYDPLTMPQDLRKAHQANDKAVMQAYGMPIKETDEAACVAWLMKLYKEKIETLS